jgi:hypothetical protein
LLRFILEGYDGLATLSTVDPDRGLVIVYIPPGCEDDVERVIRDIEKDVIIVRDNETASTGKIR